MVKKHKKQSKKQQPNRASEKKRRILADQHTDIIGNGAEKVITPEEKAYVEDTREPEQAKQENEVPESFDVSSFVSKFVADAKKNGT